MSLAENFERTPAFECVAPLVEQLGALVLFWREHQSRSCLKIDMVLFSKKGIDLALIEKVHKLLLPRLQAFCAPLAISLDISSPGMQRNIKTLYELNFFLGKKILFFTKEHCIEGILQGLEDQALLLRTQADEIIRLAKVEIIGARINN